MTIAPRGDPRWGEILQLPNLRSQLDVAGRERAAWMARNGEMTAAQQTAMDALAAALKAERDAKMAELLKQNAGRGGGGGGGRRGGSGGGGSAPIAYDPYVDQTAPWPTAPTTAPPPSFNTHLYPSSVLGADRVYKVAQPGFKGYVPPNPTRKVANPGQKGYVPPHPSTYRVVLS